MHPGTLPMGPSKIRDEKKSSASRKSKNGGAPHQLPYDTTRGCGKPLKDTLVLIETTSKEEGGTTLTSKRKSLKMKSNKVRNNHKMIVIVIESFEFHNANSDVPRSCNVHL